MTIEERVEASILPCFRPGQIGQRKLKKLTDAILAFLREVERETRERAAVAAQGTPIPDGNTFTYGRAFEDGTEAAAAAIRAMEPAP